MRELTRLRLKQDRLVLYGLAATILASFPFALAVRPEWVTAVQTAGATWLFWVIVGLPGLALLFGGAAGAQLASETSRAAETLLPLPASRRAWAYASSALIQVAALGLLIAALGALGVQDVELRAPFRIFSWWWPEYMAPFTLSFVGVLPYLLLVSLVVAYASGSGVLGGLIGVSAGALCLGGLEVGFVLRALHEGRVSYLGWALLGWSIAMGGAAAALRETAQRLERREQTSWRAIARIALTALLGALIASGAALWKARWVLDSTRFLIADHYPHAPEPRNVELRDGVVLRAVGGSIYWATPDGARKELYAGAGQLFDIYGFEASTEWDREGRLWLLVRADRVNNLYELYSGDPSAGLSLVSRFARESWVSLVRRGGELALWTYGEHAPVGSIQGQPRWQRNAWTLVPSDELALAAFEDGTAARHDAANGVVEQRLPGGRARTWRVGRSKAWAGRLPQPEIVAAVPFAGGAAFGVTVRENGGWRLKVCKADGSVIDGFTQERSGRPLPVLGGGFWRRAPHRSVEWVSPEGRTFGPVGLPIDEQIREVVRSQEARLWVLTERHLVVLDGASKSWTAKFRTPPLPRVREKHRGWEPVQVSAGGIFFQTGTTLYLMDWDGRLRNIGR